jgi:hypothetical protein
MSEFHQTQSSWHIGQFEEFGLGHSPNVSHRRCKPLVLSCDASQSSSLNVLTPPLPPNRAKLHNSKIPASPSKIKVDSSLATLIDGHLDFVLAQEHEPKLGIRALAISLFENFADEEPTTAEAVGVVNGNSIKAPVVGDESHFMSEPEFINYFEHVANFSQLMTEGPKGKLNRKAIKAQQAKLQQRKPKRRAPTYPKGGWKCVSS